MSNILFKNGYQTKTIARGTEVQVKNQFFGAIDEGTC